VRGFFDEGYSGESLIGGYLNGIYERALHRRDGLQGYSKPHRFHGQYRQLWLYTRIEVDGETLDLAKSAFSDFRRMLDFPHRRNCGVKFIWEMGSGKKLQLVFSTPS